MRMHRKHSIFMHYRDNLKILGPIVSGIYTSGMIPSYVCMYDVCMHIYRMDDGNCVQPYCCSRQGRVACLHACCW